MNNGNFYITTPIYYVNDKPHIGHAYTTVLADVLARYHRSLGVPTHFQTGTDEHGQKVQKAAEQHQMTPIEQCDQTVVRFQELWKRLNITDDFFIRTTQENHKEVVREILQELYDRGEIYRAEYKGHYCVPCERFYTAKDLVDGKCPECGREVTEIMESNYFFRMSKYQEWLIDYIKTHPDFIQPSFRANETLGFLKQELGDLCISRPKERLSWGIELPFDSDYVCYVWFDALINYISGIGYRRNDAEFGKWWPASYHLIGKDILTTHTVYWPTMLKAMGLELPRTIFAHGWWLTGREKMSKSLGNVIDPMAMVDRCGVDAFRYFLMSEMSLGQDASFTEEAFVSRYNSDLANDLGNLLSRVIKLTLRNGDGRVPAPGELDADDRELLDAVHSAVSGMTRSLDNMKLEQGIEGVMNAVRAGNRYFEKTAPWSLAKKGDTARLNTVLAVAAEALLRVAVILEPVMPEKMRELTKVLGMADSSLPELKDIGTDRFLLTGCTVQDVTGLFPRIIIEEKACAEPVKKVEKQAKTVNEEKKSATVEENCSLVTIDEFFKTKLRVARVLSAERIENADKLLALEIDLGDEKRKLVAGIARSYAPEDLIGRSIVVVANLVPAKIRGRESQGMLLAAKDGDCLRLITVDGEVAPGVSVG